MPLSDRQRKTEYLLTAAVLLIGLGYLAVFGVINFAGFARLCTADMYEDTLVARLMWEARSLFPKSYLFGNQFYVIATPALAALFYGLTGSMNRAMALATTLMSALLLLSMDWMLRPFVRKRLTRLSCLLVFFLSVFGPLTVSREDGQQLFFCLCSFYACYVLALLFVFGDYARAREDGRLRLPALLTALLLSFATGMQSPRQTCVMILPLLGFEALGLLRRAYTRRPLFPREARPALRRVLLYTAANLAGLGLIRLLRIPRHSIYHGASVFSGASVAEKLRDLHRALVTVTGYDYTRGGEARLFFALLFVFLLLLVLAAAALLIRRRGARPDGPACFWLLTLLSALAVVAASFFTSVRLRPIYLFPCYLFPALSFALVAPRLDARRQGLLTALLCLFAAANLYFSYREDLATALDRTPSPAEQLSDFAVAGGWELIYGAHSGTAPNIAVHSDGALIAGCWQDDCIFKLSPYVNIRNVYSLSDYARALFVFRSYELEPMRVETEANGTVMRFLGRFGDYHVYTASGQLLYPITETIDYNPEYN